MKQLPKVLWYALVSAYALCASTIIISYGWTDNGTSVISVAGRLVGIGTASRTGNTTPQQQAVVWGGDLIVGDPSVLGSESLTNGALTSGTSWTQTGDFALTSNAAVYTHSAGVGTIVQASGTLAVAGVGNRWYKLVYTVSGITAGMNACIVTSAFADTSFGVSFDITAGVAKAFYFKSATSPGNFVIACTSTAGGLTLDDLSLMEVQGGNAVVYGLVTGGGTAGLKILSNGNVGIGTSSPSAPFHVYASDGSLILLAQTERDAAFAATEFRPQVWSGANIPSGGIIRAQSSRGTIATPVTLSSQDRMLQISANGYDGSAYAAGGQIRLVAGSAWTGSNRETYWDFGTVAAGSTAVANQLTITGTSVRVEAVSALQQLPRTTDPGCATVADIGKFWFDNTTTTTVASKCVNVAGTLTWVPF